MSKDDKPGKVKEEIWTGVRKNPGIGEVVLYGAPPPTPWDHTIPPGRKAPWAPELNDESRQIVEKLAEEAAKTRHEKQAIPKADLDLRMRELIDEIRCFRQLVEKTLERKSDATEVGMTTGTMSSGELELKLNIDDVKGSMYLSHEMWEELGNIAGWTKPKRNQKRNRKGKRK